MDKLDEALTVRRAQQQLPSLERRRELRERFGLKHGDIANAIGVDRTTVVRWETSTQAPRGAGSVRYLEVLQRLARKLGESL
jgi:DNA-binding transcriptional regulator YiaG